MSAIAATAADATEPHLQNVYCIKSHINRVIFAFLRLLFTKSEFIWKIQNDEQSMFSAMSFYHYF